jgi:biotin-[acetyl-CoA-carboxylase] ligase BirA-like protein
MQLNYFMKIITENIEFTREIGFSDNNEFKIYNDNTNSNLIEEIFGSNTQLFESETCLGIWDYLLIKKMSEKSQYDSLIKLAQSNSVNGNILCIAGSGNNFHGFHNRSWVAEEGNIHLSIQLSPQKKINNYLQGFLALSALSVVQTINHIPQLNNKAKIKWVNDILIGNAKVSGVLAHSLTQGEIVKNVILGIGLNVEKQPMIEFNEFVPETACLNNFLSDDEKIRISDILKILLINIEVNYKKLLSGNYQYLIQLYRENSAVINREVIILSDDISNNNTIIAQGKVLNIDNNLGLCLDSQSNPVQSGRLILKNN